MRLAVLLFAASAAGLALSANGSAADAPGFDHARFDATMPGFLAEYKAAGVGIGVIRDGVLVWQGYYGEQGPGIPVTARTVFNTASVAKTVTAETMIALAGKGLIDLDEPIYTYVQDPDLQNDPRYKLLTVRLLLSHRSGLKNWAYDYKNGKLAFVADPGTIFGYSGAGVELAAKYAEQKTGRDFEELAFAYVLAPSGIKEMSMGQLRPWLSGRLAIPMDGSGKFDASGKLAPRLTPGKPGHRSAADDLLTTVEAYGALIVGLIKSERASSTAAALRTNILTSLVGDAIWDCHPATDVVCASSYGHSIGWMVYNYEAKTVLIHGGNDAGENALVYYSPQTRNGAVIFVNGANGIFVTTRALELIGDQPEMAAYYRQLVKKFYKVDMAALPR
jgi:CubicO group peptidase (beta-lactamase class C family)